MMLCRVYIYIYIYIYILKTYDKYLLQVHIKNMCQNMSSINIKIKINDEYLSLKSINLFKCTIFILFCVI